MIPTKHDVFIISLQVVTGWFLQNMTFSFFPFTGWYRVITAKHDILILSLQVDTGWFLQNMIFPQTDFYKNIHSPGRYRVILIKNDIFILSLQVDTGWFLQNMTFSRWVQDDSHITKHSQGVYRWFLQNMTFSLIPLIALTVS